jgi:hypothetical protein
MTDCSSQPAAKGEDYSEKLNLLNEGGLVLSEYGW